MGGDSNICATPTNISVEKNNYPRRNRDDSVCLPTPQGRPLYSMTSGDYVPIIVAGIKGGESLCSCEGPLNLVFHLFLCVLKIENKNISNLSKLRKRKRLSPLAFHADWSATLVDLYICLLPSWCRVQAEQGNSGIF